MYRMYRMYHVNQCGLLDDSCLALRPQAVPLCHTGFGEVVTSSRLGRIEVGGLLQIRQIPFNHS